VTGFGGRRVIVTGAASGIGRALAGSLVADGATVALVDRSASVESVASGLGERALAFRCDVGDGAAVTAAFGAAAAAMGGLDGVVNNAGIGNLKPLVDYTDREFDLLVRVNLHGTFFGIRAAVPLLRASGGGSIVNMASASGVRPTRGEAPYSAAKAGVISLTMAAALEEGPDIRVNVVSPGFIRTPLNEFLADDPATRAELESNTPAGRIGGPGDVVSVIRFLLSDDSAYMTGQNLVIDGGAVLPLAQTDGVLGRMLPPRP
jgi:NAD(P)-dependent dehydrogenase (short-subunit alcohol dehydrogenase family)